MRNIGTRREKYQTNHPEEEFIVPLIKDKIETLIDKYSHYLKSEKILDVGSGNQPFQELLTNKGGEYFSLDVEQHFAGENDFIGAIDSSLSDQVLSAGPYNFILCTEVMEHVADWDKAFSNFKLLLKEGGILVFTTPFIYMLHEEPYDYWRPTPHAFRVFSSKNKLTVVEENKCGDFGDVLGTVFGLTYFNTLIAKKPTFFNKVTAVFLRKFFSWGFRLLKSRWMNKFSVRSELYLSTIIVLSH